MKTQATALVMVASKSLASRRHRLSHANVLSTTHRRGKTSKPFAVSDRLMISKVQDFISTTSMLALNVNAFAATVTQIVGPLHVNDGSGFHRVIGSAEVAVGGSVMV